MWEPKDITGEELGLKWETQGIEERIARKIVTAVILLTGAMEVSNLRLAIYVDCHLSEFCRNIQAHLTQNHSNITSQRTKKRIKFFLKYPLANTIK